jgi:ribosomal protein L37E
MEISKVVTALNAKGIKNACLFCGTNDWIVNEHLCAAIRIDEKGNTLLGTGPLIPMIQLVCKRCGYIAQFNPIPLGLMQGNE